MYGVESLLDFSIIIPLVYPQKSVLFQVDDYKEVILSTGFGDTFLDALDASYCTFEGGDDKNLDPHYPDTAPNPANESYLPQGTYDKPEMCGAYKPTNVLSISYGLGENHYSYFYENRECMEYMKLGLQGVSVIYASGDSGVSDRGQCILPATVPNGTNTHTNPGAFSPSFPASCPYVTSVGGTMVSIDHHCIFRKLTSRQLLTDKKTEVAVDVPSEEYSSGGGFSNYWPAPSYQESTLANYFANTPPPFDNLTIYGQPYYNKSGRGYPDVAALGLDILIYYQGQPKFVSGTSAAAPMMSSAITLINEARIGAGKKSVGFLNPTLYKNPHAFTDVSSSFSNHS